MEIVPRKTNVSPIRRSEDLPRDIPGSDHFCKIPDDQYIAEYIGSVGFYYRGTIPKVALWFVITEGQFAGERIAAYCNVKSVDCNRNQRVPDPKFTVGWKFDLTTYLAALFDWYSPNELPTTIPTVEMIERGIRVTTRTVTKTHKGQQRTEPFQNSVVDLVLGWAES